LTDGSASAPSSSYSPLGHCQSGEVENRFLGYYLVVSCGSSVTSADVAVDSAVSIARWATQEVVQLDVPLLVVRIEPLGEHAIIIGPPRSNWADLRFATIRLDRLSALADMFTLTGTSQTEHRSHAFAYRPENATDGLLGLPVLSEADPGSTKREGGG